MRLGKGLLKKGLFGLDVLMDEKSGFKIGLGDFVFSSNVLLDLLGIIKSIFSIFIVKFLT